jgi:hypothetical protein
LKGRGKSKRKKNTEANTTNREEIDTTIEDDKMIDKATMITGEKGNTKTGNSQGENIRIETPEKEINQK